MASTECEWGRAVQEQVREEENKQWWKAVRSKATLMVYQSCKNEIEKQRMYDNNGGSGLPFEARAGALRTLVYRDRFDKNTDDMSAMWRVCGQEEETIPHLVLRCTCLGPRQREGTTLPETLGFVYNDDPGPATGDGAAGTVNAYGSTHHQNMAGAVVVLDAAVVIEDVQIWGCVCLWSVFVYLLSSDKFFSG
ncbi:hypothetical protein HPB51_021955 [Rhipicephalus microplus]|uniref:Tick transposon n=1 Tax=Rhipicephalus microplus TaxID=6941 RepID=A0A9J6EIT8_RHIMP|nr:hypothetical protein HPB51_021955 [Rhipicephalus microplus]